MRNIALYSVDYLTVYDLDQKNLNIKQHKNIPNQYVIIKLKKSMVHKFHLRAYRRNLR